MRKQKFPPWIRKRITADGREGKTQGLLSRSGLATVCEGAGCPNRDECYTRGRATFLILGKKCTRACRFCAMGNGHERAELSPPASDEPVRVAEVSARLGLRHVVITSVTRDDLEDGGAGHFARVIEATRERIPEAVIEVLVPDFQGNESSLISVLEARPNVFNHNLETVCRLYPEVRPGADYERSLEMLCRAKELCPETVTKSGLMVGLGETREETHEAMQALREAGCEMLTVGQYLQPRKASLPVERFVEPEEFARIEEEGRKIGFSSVFAGPFVRSSYQAEMSFSRRSL